MSSDPLSIRLARRGDAALIAAMSRDLIESGLGWSWTAGRVLRAIADRETNVVVAEVAGQRAGFGIMSYRDEDAHLLLLAVHPARRRLGVGAALVTWLEASALAAGIGQVLLEARAGNAGARAFYRRLGYAEVQRVPGYYQGREASVRLAKDLWLERPTPA
ncbi:MAG: GNAT family N-acetyltransferase [Proteobacteria bacterium]|nr:GNAT family N-acetyltransferase [Pseudomonadota bacterium]